MGYYSVKTQYTKIDNGKSTKVIQQHILEAVGITDAEIKVAAHFEKEEIPEFKISSCTEYKMHDCIIDENDDDNKWFSVKVCYSIENDNGKIQKTYENNLVYTQNIKMAYAIIESVLSKTSLQWSIDSVSKTSIHRVDTDNISGIEREEE